MTTPTAVKPGNLTWLWPDHAIGKRESRTLRDDHNANRVRAVRSRQVTPAHATLALAAFLAACLATTYSALRLYAWARTGSY